MDLYRIIGKDRGRLNIRESSREFRVASGTFLQRVLLGAAVLLNQVKDGGGRRVRCAKVFAFIICSRPWRAPSGTGWRIFLASPEWGSTRSTSIHFTIQGSPGACMRSRTTIA